MIQSLLSLLFASQLGTSVVHIDDASFDDRSLLSVNPVPYHNEEYISPGYMSAEALFSMDMGTNTLYEENSIDTRPIASLTKLMTAAIILEENDYNEVVTISPNAADTIGSSMGLYTGETITVGNLMVGLLVRSGNDAAVALAEHNAGSVSNFVEKMNEKTEELNLLNTIYKNPTGLDQSGAQSTAKDQAMLTKHLLNYPSFREIVSMKSAEPVSTTGYTHPILNTNILLGTMNITGVKTGRTDAAGECLITLGVTPDGEEVITVVLGSGNRFADTKVFLDWIYKAYSW